MKKIIIVLITIITVSTCLMGCHTKETDVIKTTGPSSKKEYKFNLPAAGEYDF